MDDRKQGYRPSVLPRRLEPASPSIMQSMQSLDSISLMEQSRMVEDESFSGRNLKPDTLAGRIDNLNFIDKGGELSQCFLLIDGNEHLQVSSAEQFTSKLGLSTSDPKVKVVSIFGNTGDGKSHSLNHIFFNGNEVFRTSAAAVSSTMGVWAAYDPVLKVVCLDTEGLLGSTDKENQRMRMLLKVLAVSDVVIYRTRAERLHRDLFTFLSSASRAYSHHFQAALQRVAVTATLSSLGPAVVVFHETKHTKPLSSRGSQSADECLRELFSKHKLEMDAFSSLRYIGIQTRTGSTDYVRIKAAINTDLRNTTVRSLRSPSVVFTTLKVLNDRFSGAMIDAPSLFADQYFTCPDECLSCKKRCQISMGHLKDNLPHWSSSKCVYQSQYENYYYLCKKCHENGIEQKVSQKSTGLVQFVWSGTTVECPTCGELQTTGNSYWSSNQPPEDCLAVRTEISHVWRGCEAAAVTQNTAQRVLDGVSYFSEALAGAVSQPTKVISSYVADQIAPSYWRPNYQITHCHGCKAAFPAAGSKHHCRSCGEGFCDSCSSQSAPVPQHGWLEPVRVCDSCHVSLAGDSQAEQAQAVLADETDVRVRKYGEIVAQTLSSVTSTVLDYPKELINYTQPVYVWRDDAESRQSTIREITKRASSDKDWPQILIFPEATCTNRTCLIKFKCGAFMPGVPVQPVCIRYPNAMDTVTWTWEGPGALKILWLTLTRLHTNCEIEFLPVYRPSADEKADPKLYANNVRKLMASTLGVPVTDYTYDHCRLISAGQRLHLKLGRSLVEIQRLRETLGLDASQTDEKFLNQPLDVATVSRQQFADRLQVSSSEPALRQLFDICDKGDGRVDWSEYLLATLVIVSGGNFIPIFKHMFLMWSSERGENKEISEETFQRVVPRVFSWGAEKTLATYRKLTSAEPLTFERFEVFLDSMDDAKLTSLIGDGHRTRLKSE